MENLDCYRIKNKNGCFLQQAYTHKYRIRDSFTNKYLVFSDGNLDWVEKPKDPGMFRDIFDPVSLLEIIFDDEDPSHQKIRGKLIPISKSNQVLILDNKEWVLKKEKYLSQDKAWIILEECSSIGEKKNKKDNSITSDTIPNSLVSQEKNHSVTEPIINENPLHQIKLNWLGVASCFPRDKTDAFVPPYVSEKIIECDILSSQFTPNLYFLYWVSMCYDSLPSNCLFLGSNKINIEEWPIHNPITNGFSTLDRQVRVRDSIVLDADQSVRDEFQRQGQCEFSVFVRQLLTISDSYLSFSSSHCYLISRKNIHQFPEIYYKSLWWRISKHPNLYPDDYLSVLWGYLTTI